MNGYDGGVLVVSDLGLACCVSRSMTLDSGHIWKRYSQGTDLDSDVRTKYWCVWVEVSVALISTHTLLSHPEPSQPVLASTGQYWSPHG